MKTNQLKIYLLVLFLLVFGCSQSKPKSEESTLLRSYRLIDSDKEDEAIGLLSHELQVRDSQAPEGTDQSVEATQLRVTLASAYAKKAGLTIREIARAYDMARSLASFKISKKSLVNPTENDQKVTDLSNLVLEEVRLIQTITVIPKVDQDQQQFLYQAVRILNSTPNLSPADLIYSVIVKVVYVRTLLESDQIKALLPKIVKENNQCVAKLSEFRNYLQKATKILLSAYDNLAAALPEKKEEIVNSSRSLVELSTNLGTLNSAGVFIFGLNQNKLNDLYRIFGVSSQDITCEKIVEE